MESMLNTTYTLLDEDCNIRLNKYKIYNLETSSYDCMDTPNSYNIHDNNELYVKKFNDNIFLYYKKKILKKKFNDAIKFNLLSKNSFLFRSPYTIIYDGINHFLDQTFHVKNNLILLNYSVLAEYNGNIESHMVSFTFPLDEFENKNINSFNKIFNKKILNELIDNDIIISDIKNIIRKYLDHYFFEWIINEMGDNWFYISSLENLPLKFVDLYFGKCKYFYLLRYQKMNDKYIKFFLDALVDNDEKPNIKYLRQIIIYFLYKYHYVPENYLKNIFKKYKTNKLKLYNLFTSFVIVYSLFFERNMEEILDMNFSLIYYANYLKDN